MKRSSFTALVALLVAPLAFAAVPAHADGPLDVARVAWTRGSRTSHRIASLLDEARRVRDPQRTMCLDDALNQTDAQLRLIQARTELLQRATAAHDRAGIDREVRVLRTVTRRIREAEILADSCVGITRHAGMDEETTVEMEAPTGLADVGDIPY